MQEFSLVLIKPSVLKRKKINEIIGKFEDKDYTILNIKMIRLNESHIDYMYGYMNVLGLFDQYQKHMSLLNSQRAIVLVLTHPDLVWGLKKICGEDKEPNKCSIGTLRFDYGSDVYTDVVYYSKDFETFKLDSQIFLGSSTDFAC
jgi:nucleoside-diphosphate kinase